MRQSTALKKSQAKKKATYSASCWSISEHQFGTTGHQATLCRRHLFQLSTRSVRLRSISRTFYANNRWLPRPGPSPGAGAVTALIIALELSICDNFYSAFNDIGICNAECSCLIGPRQRLRSSGRLPRRRCRKRFACHRCDRPSCPHCRSSGWRRPHSYIAVPVATLHFSRIPFAWRRRFRLCRDSV